MKTLFKLLLLLLIGAVAAGAVVLVKRPRPSGPVSFDQWPPVPENPAA
jgi:hypothetical protein